jgi:serine/threonine protein phosphatase PrpC
MIDSKQYIQILFTQKNIVIAPNRITLFEEYVKDEFNVNAVKQIQENQKIMMEKWALKNRIRDIIEKQLIIPNATVGKPYQAILGFDKAGLNDLVYTEFEGLEENGLVYSKESEIITGNPTRSGDVKVKMKFRISGEDDNSELHEKTISLVINADPKSLWKNVPSDEGKDDEWKEKNYWKPDNTSVFQPLGDKHIVVASKRGRSHANVGSFRDDDFAFKDFEHTGWSIVCVADGAGSAKLSRQGSKIACDGIVEFFGETLNDEVLKEIDGIVKKYHQISNQTPASNEIKPQHEPAILHNEIQVADEASGTVAESTKTDLPGPMHEIQKELKLFLYNTLGKAAFAVHKKLTAFAAEKAALLKDFHSTLIFALFKKYEFGYAVLSFGVGDCPIGLLNKDMTDLKLMNWLDVGEFGGGTRFITMPEIFSSDKFSSRFGFKLIEDFSYLMLMTDGIYDPKFVVEANLEKLEKWKEFLEDLGGNNEDRIKVEFSPDNKKIADQLSAWMDFWSPGNHDDRTLAIVF